ncbi:MAG: ABC transporter permease [Oscillospiraceae bacterium]|nr:ABC transporter permease [Oscillospiraceae bacterium]
MEFIRSVIALYAERWQWFLGLLGDHVRLALTAIIISGLLGLLIGVWISDRPKLAPAVIGVCNVLYTIPAISLLGILIPFFGIGNRTAVTALVIYGMMPMVRNTYTGIVNVDPDIIEAAVGMGSTKRQLLTRIKLPMALSVILAGLRSMVVMTISVGGIASFIGAGGLGVAIYRGITIYNPAMTFAGSLLIALTAIVADLLLGTAEKRYRKKRRMK